MTGFVEIARRAKREHELRLEQARAQAEHACRLRQEAFDRSVAILQSTILPTLRTAKAELATDGIPMLIEDNFKTAAPGANAEVSFKLAGPEIPSKHAGRVTPESVPAFFSHDGTTLCFGMGRRGARLADNVRPVLGDASAVIEHAIGQAAASYFADIEAANPSTPAAPAPTGHEATPVYRFK